ncbi:MAG: LysM peptidoglycan-binding domain-containing protein [Simkania sp.]|nr:LysM peptidoglycan-binding domain-containing protein [Simkania sp.]
MDKTIWQKRSRFLAQAFILSGALNIALLATFCFFLLGERKNQVAFDSPPAEIFSDNQKKMSNNAEVLNVFCEKNFQELVELLSNKELLEDGYSKRDFALAILVAFHQFNLEKALGGGSLQQRQILFSRHSQGEAIDLTIFPGLDDEHYKAILLYAKTERWPLTSQGLFFEIKRSMEAHQLLDSTLEETFCLSQEFLAISTLMHRSGFSLPKEELLEMLSQGNWRSIEQLYSQQKESQDLSVERGRSFLLQYLDQRSRKAACLLLKNDLEFTVRRLSDDQVLFVLDCADYKEKHAYALLKALLCSTRGERVFRIAAEKLYASVGEPMPAQWNLLQTVQRFFPEALKQSPSSQPPAEVAPASQVVSVNMEKKGKKGKYIVQEGDSLWKIARKHRCSIEGIKEINRLDSERLKPGQELQLP